MIELEKVQEIVFQTLGDITVSESGRIVVKSFQVSENGRLLIIKDTDFPGSSPSSFTLKIMGKLETLRHFGSGKIYIHAPILNKTVEIYNFSTGSIDIIVESSKSLVSNYLRLENAGKGCVGTMGGFWTTKDLLAHVTGKGCISGIFVLDRAYMVVKGEGEIRIHSHPKTITRKCIQGRGDILIG